MDMQPKTPEGILGQCTGTAPAGIKPVIIQATGTGRHKENV